MPILTEGFERVARKYKEFGPQVGKQVTHGLTKENSENMVRYAQEYLDQLVYNAPLPDSASGREEWYLANRRTRLTYRAIKAKSPMGIAGPLGGGAGHRAEAFVDPADYQEYYYAIVLNNGGAPGGRLANYRARPFWDLAKRRVDAEKSVVGRKWLREFRNRLAKG